MRESVTVKLGEMCLMTKKISFIFVNWSTLNKVDFSLSQNSLYKGDFVTVKIIILFFHLTLLITDNMIKSTEKYKKVSAQEVNKAIWKFNDAEGNKHKDDRLKTCEGARTQAGLVSRASVIGRTSVSKMKNIKKKKNPVEYSGSETNEDNVAFLRMGGWSADVV